MNWYDRFSGKPLATLPELVEPGRFCRTGKTGATFNDHTFLRQDILVPDGSDRCQLDDEIRSFVPSNASLSPQAELFASALESIDAECSRGTTLMSPLMPAEVINGQSHLLRFEELLLEVIKKGHLHQVSIRPRLDLHYEDEVTDVARAKRMAKGALVHLASHSEYWQRQTLSGVIPRKVLARFSVDDYNTYENRVYARLLDGIARHLGRRIATLEQLQGTLSRALEFYGADGVDHRLANAICALWGQTFSQEMTSEASHLLSETLGQLKVASKAIAGLKHNGLYPLVPRSAQVSGGLHLSNILSHDAHYRHVAVLWEELRKVQVRAGKPPHECHQQNRHLASAYSRYAGLMLHHALAPYLDGLDEAQWAGRTLSLRSSGLEWELVSAIPGEDAKVVLTVVPWFSFTERPDDTPGQPLRIIAWPALDQVNNDAALETGWIALSPFDLYGVERFGYLVDSILWQPLLQAYGTPITKVPGTVMRGVGEQMSAAISLEPDLAQMVVREVLPERHLAQLQQSLHAANAIQQAETLRLRHQELLALQVCPVCGVLVRLAFQQPAGFKANCGDCATERYLRHQARHWLYEQKLNAEIDFRKVGRRAIHIQGPRCP